MYVYKLINGIIISDIVFNYLHQYIGHYRPHEKHLYNLLKFLKDKGNTIYFLPSASNLSILYKIIIINIFLL